MESYCAVLQDARHTSTVIEEDAVVSPTPPSATGIAERLGLKPGMIVMESGYDDDVDEDLRSEVAERIGDDMVEEDTDEVVDVVLLWYRDGDGDLTDVLVDSVAPLADDGYIWLLTPKRGRDNYVEPSDIAEAASIAGLSQTSIATIGHEWAAARLVGRKSSGGKR
ncbi:MAG: hypothetical protein QOC66_2971 [Pseudonocardiales bacterium]|jgi:hypothetical protein|nr:hypothetical protein [Pseudonocardiales bacterium]